MKWVIVWALLACLLGATRTEAQTDTDGTARSKVTALEQIWVRALTTGDLQALDDLLDSAVIYVGPDGSLMTKAELLLYAKSTHPQRTIRSLTKIQVFDDTVVVNGTYESKESKNGKLLVREGQFTDTWFYKDSSWVCIVAQATPVLEPAK